MRQQRGRMFWVRWWASLALRLLVGGIFIYYSYGKLTEPPEKFARAIRSFQMMPEAWTNSMAIIMPWIEMYAGVLLILGVFVREARLLTAAMLLAFIGAFIYAIAMGLKIEDCGCGGAKRGGAPPNLWLLMLRNFGLLACLAIDAAIYRPLWRSARPAAGTTETGSDWAPAAATPPAG